MRGGQFHITQLDTRVAEQPAIQDPRLAELVDLKYFCGFSLTEIAVLCGVLERTAQRDWEKARLVHRPTLAELLDGRFH